MKKHTGLSLIVLVITIIVIIILAGSLILNLSNNNPIVQAKESNFKTNVGEYNSELTMAISNKYTQNSSFDPNTFDAGVWDGTVGNITGTVKQYITSITVADGAKYEIQNSKLVYVGADQAEKDWLTQIGIPNGTVSYVALGINVIATLNTTVNGLAPSYNNPIIPKGFKAIEDGAIWPTDWNNGLVIEDSTGNQFVWVPVDGTDVTYAKWCTTGTAYNYAGISDDTLPSGFSISNITTTYKGFYIARYEAMFDYNLGNLRVASKKSSNKTGYTDWSTTRNATYNGYLWNYISYSDSKNYSENMAASYGYDTLKLGTNLVTGAQWDTVMKWIQNSGTSVTDSTTWGNHNNSLAPANISGFGNLQISGYSNNWKAKNIYDLAGNTWEWTNEICNANRVYRGGGYFGSGTISPAACRFNDAGNHLGASLGFRPVLYIL